IATPPSPYLRRRITAALYGKMNVPDLVAPDREAYASLVLRLGTEREYREEMRTRIQAASAVLFEDRSAVRGWEQFLRGVVPPPRRSRGIRVATPRRRASTAIG